MANHSRHAIIVVDTQNIRIVTAHGRVFRTFTVSGELNIVNQPFQVCLDFGEGLFSDVAFHHIYGIAFTATVSSPNPYPQKF